MVVTFEVSPFHQNRRFMAQYPLFSHYKPISTHICYVMYTTHSHTNESMIRWKHFLTIFQQWLTFSHPFTWIDIDYIKRERRNKWNKSTLKCELKNMIILSDFYEKKILHKQQEHRRRSSRLCHCHQNQQNWRDGKKDLQKFMCSTAKLFYCIIKVFAENPQRLLLSLYKSPLQNVYLIWYGGGCPFKRYVLNTH